MSFPNHSHFFFKGFRRIRIGCKMQEAAAKYQGEGFSHIYYALAGTDTQVLIDMLSEMFGEPTTMEPEELDSASVKRQRTSAMEEEEKLAEASGERDPSKGPTTIYPTGPKVPTDYGIESAFLPRSVAIKEADAHGDLVIKTYYQCVACPYKIQNKISVITHTRRDHLNIKIGCRFCSHTTDAAKSMEKHFSVAHKAKFGVHGLSAAEAQDVVDTIAEYENLQEI